MLHEKPFLPLKRTGIIAGGSMPDRHETSLEIAHPLLFLQIFNSSNWSKTTP